MPSKKWFIVKAECPGCSKLYIIRHPVKVAVFYKYCMTCTGAKLYNGGNILTKQDVIDETS